MICSKEKIDFLCVIIQFVGELLHRLGAIPEKFQALFLNIFFDLRRLSGGKLVNYHIGFAKVSDVLLEHQFQAKI